MGLPKIAKQFDQIKNDDAGSNDDTLADLQAVDARQDIDRVRAKDGQHDHVDVVQNTQVQGETDPTSQGLRDNHSR